MPSSTLGITNDFCPLGLYSKEKIYDIILQERKILSFETRINVCLLLLCLKALYIYTLNFTLLK